MIDLKDAANDLRMQQQRLQVARELQPSPYRAAILKSIASRLWALSRQLQDVAGTEAKNPPKTDFSQEKER